MMAIRCIAEIIRLKDDTVAGRPVCNALLDIGEREPVTLTIWDDGLKAGYHRELDKFVGKRVYLNIEPRFRKGTRELVGWQFPYQASPNPELVPEKSSVQFPKTGTNP
jgi:hypothetical protein